MLRLAGVNKKGSDNRATLNHHSDHYSDASLAFFLWRRLISCSKALTTNCPVLSSFSLSVSTASAISCGTRTSKRFDFALMLLVAMVNPLSVRCPTEYLKKASNKSVDLSDTLGLNGVRHLIYFMGERARPGSATNTYQTSIHNVSEVYTMAYSHSTQTRPEKTYQWRFLALNRSDMSAKFCRVSVEALTEHDARMVLAPFFILSFAGRLPVQEVANV